LIRAAPVGEARVVSFVELAGRRFHYLDRGAAGNPGVLLLHGFNQTCHSWDELAPRLVQDGLRVVAMDQRGHGDSEPALDGDYGREAMADDVARLADALAIERFAVVGMSMGAANATLAAVRHAARVRGLVLVDWAPEVEASGVGAIARVSALAFPSFEAAVAAMHAHNPRRSLENLRARLAHSMVEGADGRWRWKVDGARLAAHPRFREPPEVMWRALEQISCPTLLVRGAESDLLAAPVAERVTRTVRTAELCTIPAAGHSVAGDNPDAFYAAVGPFLARVAPG
jgi:pimeloyl-ACP methyl ester carboxylesterase